MAHQKTCQWDPGKNNPAPQLSALLLRVGKETHPSLHWFIRLPPSMSDSLRPALWIVAHQALLSMGFSRQEYWRGLPFPFPGDLPNPRIEPGSPAFPSKPSGKPCFLLLGSPTPDTRCWVCVPCSAPSPYLPPWAGGPCSLHPTAAWAGPPST